MASLAILIAASLDSAPVVNSTVRVRLSGSVVDSREAKSTTGLLSMPLNKWSSVATEFDTASTIAGCEWPSTALI
ncbi:Uncharacterised protein [Mycobacteroides abscessus subsp. abscessus]|nr:Uncharacterised protein [Mycobacteroides abscessus subsp. abscessus]